MNPAVPNANDFLAILPYIILGGSGVVFLVFQFLFHSKNRIVLNVVSLCLVFLGIYFSYASLTEPGLGKYFQNQIKISELTIWLNILYLITAFITISVGSSFLKKQDIDFPEFYSLVLFATLGMMFMTSGADLLVIFIGLEIMSISLYILVGMGKHSMNALEATMKYFLLGAFSSGFMLMGIAFLFGGSGSTDLEVVMRPIAQSGYLANYTKLGLALLLIGVFFKIAVFPFHAWTPDVYDGAMTPITGFMASGPKAAAMSLLMILFSYLPFGDRTSFWSLGLAILAASSMTWGNLVALKQTNLKRMLAYSSISHAGYVLAGVVAGANLEILYYLYIYAFTNLTGFAIISYLESREDHIILENLKNLMSTKPWTAIGLSLVFLSLAGFPPLAGFWAKLFLFQKIAESEQWLNRVLLVVGVMNSAIAFFYYIKVFINAFMVDSTQEFSKRQEGTTSFGFLFTGLVGTLFIGLVWLLFQPASFL